MTRGVVIAFETIGKLDLSSPTPLAKYGTVFQIVFSFFDVRWALGGEDAWDLVIMGQKKKGGGGRGMCSEEVLLEAGADCTGSETSFYYE